MTRYLEKQCLFPPLLVHEPNKALGIIIVIPCHNEAHLLNTFQSIYSSTLPNCAVEVITIINDGENSDPNIKLQNETTLTDAVDFSKNHSTPKLFFHTIYKSNLPKKHAGVGLARKIGMDEAVYRFESIQKSKGVIVCFDADSQCQENYLVEIESHFKKHPKTPACSIHYEHPVRGEAFDSEIYKAIIDYELHLRYYVHIQRWMGFPFAFQTIGSSMAVRCDAYQQQGGMNKRKAGEDFYFLHKFTHSPWFTELKTTKVIPSPRISDRVPFGTGKAVGEIIESQSELLTYNPQAFVDLKPFLEQIPYLYKQNLEELDVSQIVKQFLLSINIQDKLIEIRKNSASEITFISRFYKWFDAFMMMKYVHYARDYAYENIPIGEAVDRLFKLTCEAKTFSSNLEKLQYLRILDQQ